MQNRTALWTEHELAEIKAARAKRKEAKSLAKAAKVRTKTANEKVWGKQLRKSAMQSTEGVPESDSDVRSRGGMTTKLRQAASMNFVPREDHQNTRLVKISLQPLEADKSTRWEHPNVS